MKRLLIAFLCLTALPVWAQLAPLPVESDTVARWNFNTDSGVIVSDSAVSPLDGQNFTSTNEAVPGIPTAFGLGYKFSGASSFLDFGPAVGSKVDFTGATEFRVEAVIHMTSPAAGTQMIYNSENVRFSVINNQLAGIIRQPGGLYGLVSDVNLQQNTSYRVGLHFKNKTLVLTINGVVDSKVILDYLPGAPEFSTSRISIGGDIFGRYFHGYIDDVRVSNTAGVDLEDPTITVVEPTTFQVATAHPHLLINLFDSESGIDPSSVVVTLNGITQGGLTVSATQISGEMTDPLLLGFLNEVKIIARDFAGNSATKQLFLAYTSIESKGEYTTDLDTLALWHMNDFGAGDMKDSSGHGHDGLADMTKVSVGDGVFSKGKVFNSGILGSQINFDGVRIADKFTFEGWMMPTADNGGDENLFYNGQVQVARTQGGYIRVLFYTTGGTVPFLSTRLVMPIGEMHHLAVTWDGTTKLNNLKIYRDGAITDTLSAVADCDFDITPKIGIMGSNFTGLMDEVRVSSSVRQSFNIPTLDNQVISFMSLQNGTSTKRDHPELHAVMNSSQTIQVSTAKIRLNDLLQPINQDLTVTTSAIDGVLTDSSVAGLNTIDIEFTDSDQNMRKKSQYFFRIKELGLSQAEVDGNTIAYWSFDNLNPLKDITNSFTLTTSTPALPVTGKIGSGYGLGAYLPSATLSMQCRSHTVEGFFKATNLNASDYNLYSINGSSMAQSIALNPNNGNLHLVMSLNGFGIDKVLAGAFPTDGAYHHVALTYDGTRGFAQVLVLIDGEVKGSYNFKNSCNVLSGMNLTMGDYNSNTIAFDEFRISKTAKYGFNIQPEGTDLPLIESLNILDGQTNTSEAPELTFNVSDTEGIDTSKSKVFVNGIAQVTSFEQQKTTTVLTMLGSSDLELVGGMNLIQIKVYDLKNNETIKSLSLYYFRQLPKSEYSVDPATVFLYHMNETTGESFEDSTGHTTQSTSGWALGVPAIFSTGASNSGHGNTVAISNASGFGATTFEAWLKRGVGSTNYLLNDYQRQVLSIESNNSISFNAINGTARFSIIPSEFLNNSWHHYTLIRDPSNLIRNVYILIDGHVVASYLVPLSELGWGGTPYVSIGQYLQGGSMDEVRLSNVARYELISTKE